MICKDPAKWFGDVALDARDKALLTGEREAFVEYSQGSFLGKMYSSKNGQDFETHEWTVENTEECKRFIKAAGGKIDGKKRSKKGPYTFMTGAKASGFNWGYLSTHGKNVRYLKGPKESCDLHPWDAIILRDCTANTSNLSNVDAIASRKFDIMVMKMCEDFDHPWVVVCVKDSGENVPEPLHECCKDPNHLVVPSESN